VILGLVIAAIQWGLIGVIQLLVSVREILFYVLRKINPRNLTPANSQKKVSEPKRSRRNNLSACTFLDHSGVDNPLPGLCFIIYSYMK